MNARESFDKTADQLRRLCESIEKKLASEHAPLKEVVVDGIRIDEELIEQIGFVRIEKTYRLCYRWYRKPAKNGGPVYVDPPGYVEVGRAQQGDPMKWKPLVDCSVEERMALKDLAPSLIKALELQAKEDQRAIDEASSACEALRKIEQMIGKPPEHGPQNQTKSNPPS